MDCAVIEPDVVAFHFGVIEEEARTRVEAHLVGCRECLASYLTLKRQIETGGADARPSRAAKSKLRAAVAVEVGACVRPRWERPLAWAMAGATVVAALLAVQVMATSPGTAPRGITAVAGQR